MTDYSTDASAVKTALDAIYAKKTSLPTKTSDLTNDGDGTNAFLTQHQSLTDYVQKSNGANTMTDSSAYSRIGTSANATQKQINAKIDEKLDDIYNTFLREIISISASRRYLLSGEKTDLIVKLTNGLGTPLANKSVTVSDGTSSYNGITNSTGVFALEEMGSGTYTASYGNVSNTCEVHDAVFIDWGTADSYSTAWTNTSSRVTVTRSDTETTLKQTSGATSTGFYELSNKITSTSTVECDVYVSGTGQQMSVRHDGTVLDWIALSEYSLSANTWYHWKWECSGTTLKTYVDGVLNDTQTLSNTVNRFSFRLNTSSITIKYKNFVVY